MSRPARRSRPGFTLIELMISLVIIGIITMAVAPSLSDMLADNRQNSAAWDIIRLARRARSLAISSGAAHLLRIRNTDNALGSNGLGIIRVYAGMNSKCAQTNWNSTFSPAAGSGLGPHETFDMAFFNPAEFNTPPTKDDDDRPVIWFEVRENAEAAVPNTTGLQICYQPNGEIFSATTYNATSLAVQSSTFLLTVKRAVNDASRGIDRQVLFPTGGNARLR